MHRRWIRKLALIAGVSLLAAGCGGGDDDNNNAAGSDSTSEATKDPIIIGAVFDLSGPTSDVGKPYADGITGYKDFVNSKGGIDGHEIDLRGDDYQYKPELARQFYGQRVEEGAVAFVGWGTADVEELRSRVTTDEIPIISASYAETLSDPKETPYNFFPGVSYSQQMRIVLNHIAGLEKNAQTKVAVFHSASPFGESPLQDGKDFIAEKKLNIDFVAVKMVSGAPDFNAQLQNEAKGAKYIVIQNVPTPAAKLARNVLDSKHGAKIICLNYCSDEIYVKAAAEAAEGTTGVMFFAPPAAAADASGLTEVSEWLKSKGTTVEAAGLRYVQGWFTMKAMVEGITNAVEKADGELPTGPQIKAGLEEVKNFKTGVGPDITFSGEDHAGIDATPLYQVKDGVWTKLTDTLSL